MQLRSTTKKDLRCWTLSKMMVMTAIVDEDGGGARWKEVRWWVLRLDEDEEDDEGKGAVVDGRGGWV